MKYTSKVTLEIPMKEFLLYAIPITKTKKELHDAIRQELYQSIQGIFNGENGGSAANWKRLFYENLYMDGHITQTPLCRKEFGDFDSLRRF